MHTHMCIEGGRRSGEHIRPRRRIARRREGVQAELVDGNTSTLAGVGQMALHISDELIGWRETLYRTTCASCAPVAGSVDA